MSHVISYDELEKLVLNASAEDIRETFADYSEQERKKLSVKTRKLRSQLFQSKANDDASAQLKKAIAKQGQSSWNSKELLNVSIAAFALCPLSSLKSDNFSLYRDDRRIWQKVISDRKPAWLDDWLDYDLQQDFGIASLADILSWMEDGLCSKPTADGYIQRFARELMSFQHDKNKPPHPPISERLISNPILLDDIWRLFEVENQAFNTEPWLTLNAPQNYETWPEALLKLSNEGVISRERLLRASLSGLHEDLKQNQLSGFHKFHTRLEPTKEERYSLQPEYIALLGHQVGHVVKFGLTMVAKTEKDGGLDIGAFLSESSNVFMQDAKGNAATVLKLIKKVIKGHPEFKLECLKSAAEGLRHKYIDIQEEALNIIESEWESISQELADELQTVSNYTAATVRTKISRLCGVNDGGEQGVPSEDDAKIDYKPLVNDISQQSVLPYVEEIVAIQDVEELIAALSHAVEVVDSPDEVERIIDAMSRLCDNKPDNFDDLVNPLKYRLDEGGGLDTSNGIASGWSGLRLAIADLIMTWITGTLYRSPIPKHSNISEALIPAVERIKKITNRVFQGSSAQTLAAPTHASGWIDPVMWVSRLAQMQSTHLETDREDFCLSLLRLAPEKRDEALRHSDNLSNEIKRIAQFALGGELEISSKDKTDYDLWISAARCRAPLKDWSDEFAPFRLIDTWADSLQPVKYSWKAYVKNHRNEHKIGNKTHVSEWKSPTFEVEIGVENIEDTNASQGLIGKISGVLKTALSTDWKRIPTAALSFTMENKELWNSDFNTPWVSHWLTYQWPQCPESAYIIGARRLSTRIDENSSVWDPNFSFFHGLFVSNRPWGMPSHLMLCMGLAGKDADVRGLAIDAFIEGIENNILDAQTTSSILISLSENGWLKLNRLGDNLQQVSHVSKTHAWVVFEIISNWLGKVSPKQNNFFKMLEVFLEVQTEINAPLTPDVRDVLVNIKGSSKSAKISKKILESVAV
jgi:hypothetical protein